MEAVMRWVLCRCVVFRQLSEEEIAQLRSTPPEFFSADEALLPGVWPGATCQISGSPLQEVLAFLGESSFVHSC